MLDAFATMFAETRAKHPIIFRRVAKFKRMKKPEAWAQIAHAKARRRWLKTVRERRAGDR